MKNAIFGFFVCAISCSGQGLFRMLSLPISAEVQALGGDNVSLKNNWSNPAAFDSTFYKSVWVSYSPYLQNAHYLNVAYVPKPYWAFALQTINFGKMTETDAVGNILGTFRAGDYALSAYHWQKKGAFSLGMSLKLVGSSIANFQSLAALADAGVWFQHPKHDFSFGIVAKSFGLILKKYSSSDTPTLPNDVQVGVSYKAKYMPIRFSLTAINLQYWQTSPKLRTHLLGGLQLLIHRKIQFQLGYRPQRRIDLKPENFAGVTGLSSGILLRFKRFDFQYSYAFYQPQIINSFFTLVLNKN